MSASGITVDLVVAVALTIAPVGHVDMGAEDASGGELVWQLPTFWTSWARPEHHNAVMLRDPRTEQQKIRPISYDPGDRKHQMELHRDFIDTMPFKDGPPLTEPEWVPSDVPTNTRSRDGQWMKLQL
jgi:hypothetical protein